MSIVRPRALAVAALMGLALVCAPLVADRTFNPSAEFPNLFLPKEYRDLPPDRVPAEVVRQARADMEAALQSLFKRLVVPVNVKRGDKVVTEMRP